MNSKIDFRDDIAKCVEVLRAGGIILYPTDTIWSFGCDATNALAVQKLIELLKITDNSIISILLDNSAKLQSYLEEVPEMAWDLIDMSDKPLSIVYSNPKNLAENLLNKDKTIAIRISKEEFSRNLCTRFRNPLVAIPIELVEKGNPQFFSQLDKILISKMDYVVNYRQSETVKPINEAIIKLGNGNIFKLIKE